MALPGLVAAENLADVNDIEAAWDNLGDGVEIVISGVTTLSTIRGKDILALAGVNRASTRDFVFIKGLTASVQPRLDIAAASTGSGTTVQGLTMLRASPTTNGNYLFSNGLTLSGASVRVNGTPVLSIATSPFIGNDATTSILLQELRPQANWRITEPMTNGTIASPEVAVPFETDEFLLFMKAGQN